RPTACCASNTNSCFTPGRGASRARRSRERGRVVRAAGAARGQGRAYRGRVILLHRRAEAELAECIGTLPGNGHFGVQASITDSQSLARAAAAVKTRCGKLDVLVNTAGFTKPVPAA